MALETKEREKLKGELEGEIHPGLLDFLSSCDERIEQTNKLLEELLGIARGISSPPQFPKTAAETAIENIEDFQTLHALYANLSRKGYTEPTLVAYNIQVAAGKTFDAVVSLPPNRCCIQRTFQIWSDGPEFMQYLWRVDSEKPARESVPLHSMIPNVAPGTEESIFGRYWIKRKFLYFYAKNTHSTDTLKVWPRAWAQFTTPDLYDNFIAPVFDAQLMHLQARGEYFKTGEKLKLPTPLVRSSTETIENPSKVDPQFRCKVCNAVVRMRDGNKAFRDEVAQTGKGIAHYGVIHPCPLMYLATEEELRAHPEVEEVG